MFGNALRRSGIVALIGLLAIGLTGCGSGDDSSSKSGSKVLKVGYPAPFADMLNYVADSKGFFKEHGVDVELSLSNGANLPGEIASGRTDIAAHAVGVAMSLTMQGKPERVIYGLTGGGQGGSMFVRPDTDTVEDLKSGCKVAAFPAGTSAYGYAQTYIDNLGLDCEIVPFQDVPSQLGALAAGRVDAIVGVYTNFITAVQGGKAKLLIDSRDPATSEKYIGTPYAEVALWGSERNLKEKADLLPGYLAAINEAAEYVSSTPADTVAKEIAAQPNLKGLPVDQIALSVETLTAYRWRGTDNGHISEDQWKASLKGVATWGLPGFSPDNKDLSYDNLVDMSYLDDATK